MALSHNDATLTSGNIEHHLSGRNPPAPEPPSQQRLSETDNINLNADQTAEICGQ